MSFDLRIHFSGLLMYVPDTRGARPKMHMLLPATHHKTDHNEHHFAGLVFDSAYRTQGSKRLDRKYVFVPFDHGGLLDLTGIAGAANIHLDFPREIPSMETVGKPVEKAVVDNPAHPKLAGRVTVDAGAMTDCALGASYFFDKEANSVAMTDHTEWTIRGITSTVGGVPTFPERVVRPAGAGHPEQRLPNLFPIGETIHLHLLNVISDEFAPDGPDYKIVRDSHPAQHFDAYYDISAPKVSRVIPRRGKRLKVDVDGWPTVGSQQSPGGICVNTSAVLEP